MEPKISKTKTAAQRRVYGKRRADAPRAVFDQRSPPKDAIQSKKTEDVEVEVIQAKLAQVTINEEPAPPWDVQVQLPEGRSEAMRRTPITTKVLDESTVSTSAPPSPDTPVSQPSRKVTKKTKHYETMMEVRIYSNQNAKATQGCWGNASSPSTGRKGAARKEKSTPRRSSGSIHDIKVNDYVRPILNEALSPVAAQSVQKFSTWASRSAKMFDVAKLAEGSYGEVYKLHLRDETCRPRVSKSKLARLKDYGDGVFKVLPLRAQSGPGSKKFTSIDEIVSEVKMLKYLDPIPGFARFREIHVVQGRFPASFQSAWDNYKKTKDDCLNPNPSSKRAYPDSQLWAIVEMDDAGCELEKFCWSSVFQIYDIFWGVAMSLARAEEYALFEHRDLHLGNVCIRSTRPGGCMNPPSDLQVASQPISSGFGLSSLETTIIDYSLSRADLQLAEPENSVEIASSDLDKKQIFDAEGRDEDEVLLRNTYRYMRATLYNGNPLDTDKSPDIPGIWAEYAPRTNLIWLLFLLKTLLKNRKSDATPQTASQPQRKALAPCSPNKFSSGEKPSTKNKPTKQKDNNLAEGLLKERQTKETQARVSRLKQTLEDRLKTVLELLDLEHGHEDMCCAADLVAYAMDSQWLDEMDFF